MWDQSWGAAVRPAGGGCPVVQLSSCPIVWALYSAVGVILWLSRIGILIKRAMSKGGVHKLQIFSCENYDHFFQKSSA